MAELHEVDAWLDALLAQLEPSARTRVLREVRRIQQANITAQRAPDGTAWEPRRATARSKKGRIRRGMFAKLKTARYLKAQANVHVAEVVFVPSVQKIARVHHYGLRERTNKKIMVIKYTRCELIGINDEAKQNIKNILLP